MQQMTEKAITQDESLVSNTKAHILRGDVYIDYVQVSHAATNNETERG